MWTRPRGVIPGSREHLPPQAAITLKHSVNITIAKR